VDTSDDTRVERDVDTEAYGISDALARLVARDKVPTPCGCVDVVARFGDKPTPHQTHRCYRPYRVWRAEEHAFFSWQAWARMIEQRPFSTHQSRQWARSYAEKGIREGVRPSVYVDLDEHDQPRSVMRNVGPHDALAGSKRPMIHRSVPSPAVHIDFPDWVKWS